MIVYPFEGNLEWRVAAFACEGVVALIAVLNALLALLSIEVSRVLLASSTDLGLACISVLAVARPARGAEIIVVAAAAVLRAPLARFLQLVVEGARTTRDTVSGGVDFERLLALGTL